MDYNASKAHHTPEGFKNRYVDRADGPGFFKWQWERMLAGLPKPPEQPIVGILPDLKYIQSKHGETAITWVGHATALLQVDSLNILPTRTGGHAPPAHGTDLRRYGGAGRFFIRIFGFGSRVIWVIPKTLWPSVNFLVRSILPWYPSVRTNRAGS